MLDWLIDQKAWKAVDTLTERFAPRFAAEPGLLYSLAQAYAERGEKDRAEETALRAFHLHPGKQEEQLVHHYAVAQQLRDRGQFAWARREFEHVIGQGGEEEELTVMSRIYLSEMLHEQGQDLDAAEALEKLVRAIDAGKVTEAEALRPRAQRRSLAGCTTSSPAIGKPRTTRPSSANIWTRR